MSISIVQKLVFQNFLSVIVKSCFYLFSVSFLWEKKLCWENQAGDMIQAGDMRQTGYMRQTGDMRQPSAVKEEEIDPLGGQEELGIFQMLDKLEDVTESLFTR